MTPDRIRKALSRSDFWTDLHVHEVLGSTIDTLKALADAGAPQGTAVVAWEQTAGRGRSGRHWASPRGGVWLSALLRPGFAVEQAGCVSVLSAVAVAQGFCDRYGVPVQVKWPNDLWLDGKKLSGLLVDLSSRETASGAAIDWLVVSVGTNVNNPLPDGARVPPVSLGEALGRSLDLAHVAATVLDALASGYEAFLRDGFGPVADRWATLSALGDVVEFEQNGRPITASVVGLNEDGKLVVQTLRGQTVLAAEEVRVRLPIG